MAQIKYSNSTLHGSMMAASTNTVIRVKADVSRLKSVADSMAAGGANPAALEDSVYFGVTALSPAATATIATSSVANPSVIATTLAHGITNGYSVIISGHSGSTPDINGTHVATVTGATTFTIPVNVTIGGTGGTVTTAGVNGALFYTALANLNTNLGTISAASLADIDMDGLP